MSLLFNLSNSLLGRLRFGGKFTLVGVLFLLPLALVFYYFQSALMDRSTQLDENGV